MSRMSDASSNGTGASLWRDLKSAKRSLLVIDVVESVRLMQRDEAAFIRQWLAFVDELQKLLPQHAGRLVKSYGDGCLMTFQTPEQAVASAFCIAALITATAPNAPSAYEFQVRMGGHLADVVIGDLDIYGSGVNLTARLAGLAGPNELVVSASMRDQLLDPRIADVTDLGYCYLKHFEQDVRAFRATPPGKGRRTAAASTSAFDGRPMLAVMPFRDTHDTVSDSAIGHVIAHDLNLAFSKQRLLGIISPLSTGVFTGQAPSLDHLRAVLGAAYVLSGTFAHHNKQLVVRASLHDARSGELTWASAPLTARLGDIFLGLDEAMETICTNVCKAVAQVELRRAAVLPIPTLDGYTLYLSAIVMMHRLWRDEFVVARELLDTLAERHPRSAAPQAMLAKWHTLHALQGWSPDNGQSMTRARDSARRAMDVEPTHSFAMSMDALIMAHQGGDLDRAERQARMATSCDPQEPNAWLTLGGIHAYIGDGDAAERAAAKAVALSPTDPAAFLCQVFLSSAKIAAGKYEEAAEAARASIRLNAQHPASHRLLTIALALGEHVEQAQAAGQQLLRIVPEFRVSAYARSYAGRDRPHAATRFNALLRAGLPQ